MEKAWIRDVEDVAREFSLDLHTGLTEAQVQKARQKYGKNGSLYPALRVRFVFEPMLI